MVLPVRDRRGALSGVVLLLAVLVAGCGGGSGGGSGSDGAAGAKGEDGLDGSSGGTPSGGVGVTISSPYFLIADTLDTGEFTLVLNTAPDGIVTLAMFADEERAYFSSASSPTPQPRVGLQFTPATWDVPQPVTVHPVVTATLAVSPYISIRLYIDLAATTDTTGYAALTPPMAGGLFALLGGSSVLFVKPGATGAADGSTWTDAFTTVQAGVDAATAGQQVWVAQGAYKPASTGVSALVMKAGVAVLGGFAGNEVLLGQRPEVLLASVLSGDFNGDDVPGNLTTNRTDNSDHVVVGASNAVLDGFTVTNGFANGALPANRGAGMYNSGATGLVVANTKFEANWSTDGAGLANLDASSTTLTNVSFTGNLATATGGGLSNGSGSSLTLSNVTFTDNIATSTRGGGISNNAANATLNQVTFTGNSTDGVGGGMANLGAGTASLNGVVFTDNFAQDLGGGMWNDTVDPILSEVTFTGNSSNRGGGMSNSSGANPILTDVLFIANIASGSGLSFGGGMYNASSSPTLTRVTFTGNSTEEVGGGMYNTTGSNPSLTHVVFDANTSVNEGGGMVNSSSSPTLTDVTFSGNTTPMDGGGMFNLSSSPTLTRVTFSGNEATSSGGGMYNNASSITLTHVTFSGNSATSGGGMRQISGAVIVRNAAFWGNTGSSPDVNLTGGTLTLSASCSQQDLTGLGSGNVTLVADPFVPAASGEVFLNQGSACVNAGSESLVIAGWHLLTTHIDGTLDADGVGANDIDMGRHYDAAQAWVKMLVAGATNLTWTTNGATACTITNDADADEIVVPAPDLASGSMAHGQANPTVMTLTCQGTVGVAAIANATVP